MTNQEFDNEFDVLYNNITSNSAPGLDQYEKSVFLTQAQEQIVLSYFDPKLNKPQEGYDGSERRQIDFSMLMRTIEGTQLSDQSQINIHTSTNAKYYGMPTDVLLYINEILKVKRKGVSKNLVVVPITYTEYNRLMSKPFKRPLRDQAWRLITSGTGAAFSYTNYEQIATVIAQADGVDKDAILDIINNKNLTIQTTVDSNNNTIKYLGVDNQGLNITNHQPTIDGTNLFNLTDDMVNTITPYLKVNVNASTDIVELIPGPKDTIQSYIIRYVARPKPIILVDLTDEGVSLGGGKVQEQACELDPIIHHEILQRAVELAKAATTGNLTDAITLGQASGTPMGAVASSNNRQ